MKKIAVLFGAVAVLASGAMAGPAQATSTNIVQDTYDAVNKEVRARVCTEEHGYGVVNCSETIDPVVSEVGNTIAPAMGVVGEAGATAWDAAIWAAENGPGIVEDEADYVYCWVVDPTNPDCRGIPPIM